MKSHIFSLAVLCTILAVTAVAADPAAQESAVIETGRLDAMVGQIGEILGRRDGQWNAQVAMASDARGQLLLAVRRFDQLLPEACSSGKVAATHCAPYRPAWLDNVPPDLLPAIDDAYAHILPVWKAICQKRTSACIM